MKQRTLTQKTNQKTTALKLRPDSTWISERRRLLRQVKREVSRRLGAESADLRLLRARYERELRASWKISDKAALLDAIARADFVYGGDFHASAQSQRAHLRILRSVANDRPIVLGLECFARSSQRWLDLYLSDGLTLEELKVRVDWTRRWGFPWENYRPLLEIAKRRGFGLIGLGDRPGSSAGASIPARERNASEVIAKTWREKPAALIYIIFGDLHLAQAGLPAAVRERFRLDQAKPRELVVHLNAEKIYFELARRGLELTVDVVRLAPDRFCVMSSPPWLQWQSYLLHLERSQDESRKPSKEKPRRILRGTAAAQAEIVPHRASEAFDPTDQVAELVRLAARDLKIDPRPILSRLAVYSAGDTRARPSLERKLAARDSQIAQWLLAEGRSFFLPAAGAGYLARPSINHAATIAGQAIHASLSGRKRAVWRMPGDFSRLIWVEAIAYFISKLINHQRRSATLSDLKSEIASAVTDDARGVEAMKLAMDRLVSELIFSRQGRLRASRLKPRRKSSYLDAARILGGMLGDRLFLAHRSRKLSREEIVTLLKLEVTGGSFERDYQDILRALQSLRVGVQMMSRRERL